MRIKFIKNAYHPRRRTYGNDFMNKMVFDFYKDVTYDLPDNEARYHINKGEAVSLVYLKAKPISEMFKAHQPPTNPKTVRIAKILGFKPNPQARISLPIQDKATLKALINKELVKGMTSYFSDKDIPVKDIAKSLIKVMDYAIDIKDDLMISKVAGDLQTLLRLTEIEKDKKDD